MRTQVERARRTIAKRELAHAVSVEQADYTATHFPNASFDVIWALESVCHTRAKAAMAGRMGDARTALDRAFGAVRVNREGMSESAFWRIKGSLLEARNPADLTDAIACYREAVSLTRAAHVLAPGLRAATGLHIALGRLAPDGLRSSPLAALVIRYPAAAATPDLRAARAALEAMPVALGRKWLDLE